MTLLDEPGLIVLSTVRHVRTPEGSKFYGLPIGSPITAALEASIKAAKAAQGIKAPDDAKALSDSPVGSADISTFKSQGFSASDLGINKHLEPEGITSEALDAMKPGAGLHVVYKDGTHRVLTKNPDGTWAAEGFTAPVSSDGLAFAMGASDNVVQTSEGEDVPQVDAPKATKNLKPGDNIDSAEHLASLDDGTHVQHKITKAVYQKHGDTLQSTTGGYNKKVSSLNKVFAQKNLKYHSPAAKGADTVDTADPNGPKHQPGTVLSHDQVGGLPAGHQTKYEGSGETYTSNGDGTHTHEDTGTVIDHNAFGPAAEQGKVTYVGKKKNPEEVPDGGAEQGAGDGPAGGNAGAGGSGSVPEGVGPAGDDAGLGHPDGDGAGLELKFGGEATVKQEVPQSEGIKALAAAGKPTPQYYELDPATSAGAFHSAIQALKDHSTHASSVYVYSEDEYKGMRLFLNKEGTSGFALHGDDVVSVFSHPDPSSKGSGRAIIQTAVDMGGKRLDAFDTMLPGMYAGAGFVAVARVKWDDQYAPENWNPEDFKQFQGGKPDVVFMALAKDGKGHYSPGDGVTIENYDDGAGVQEEFLKSGTIKAPKAHPLEEDHAPKVGETVTSPDQIKALGVGAVLNLHMAESGEDYPYTRAEDGKWYIEGSKVPSSDDAWTGTLKNNGKGSLVTVKALPPTEEEKAAADKVKADAAAVKKAEKDAADAKAAADAEKAAKAADAAKATAAPADTSVLHEPEIPATHVSDLSAIDVGSHMTLDMKGWTVGYTKTGPDEWTRDDDPSFTKESADFKSFIKKGQITFLAKKPEAPAADPNNVYDGAPEEGAPPVAVAEPDMDSPTVTIVPGESLVSKNEIATSLAALQAASGFQVKYGLKGTPLADLSSSLTSQAQAAYPGTPAKPAVIAYLKSKLGIKEADAPAADDGDMIHIGASTPKSTGVQGLNGGDFTKAQIEDAIKILEAHKGKVFKSELGKKGSPLSSLNPSSMIDVPKGADKSENKAKFIALLQAALDQHSAAKPTIGQPLTIAQAKNLQVGDTFYPKADGPNSAYAYEVLPGNKVKSNGETYDMLAEGNVSFIEHGNAIYGGKKGATPAVKAGDDLSGDSEAIDALPTKASIKNEGMVYTHQASGAWMNLYGNLVSSDDLAAMGKVEVNNPTGTLDEPAEPADPAAGSMFEYGQSLSTADLASLLPGDQFKHKTGIKSYTVDSSGMAAVDQDGEAVNLQSGFMKTAKWTFLGQKKADATAPEQTGFTEQALATPKVGDALTTHNMLSVPIGAVVQQKFIDDDSAASSYDHVAPNLWINQTDSGDQWNDADFAKLVKHPASVISITSLPSTGPKPGDMVTGADIQNAQIGSKFGYVNHVYEKISDTEVKANDATVANKLATLVSIANAKFDSKPVTFVSGAVEAPAAPEAPAPITDAPSITPITPEQFDNAKPGSILALDMPGVADPTDPTGWITKQPNGEYVSQSTGNTVTVSFLHSVVKKHGGKGFVQINKPANKTGFVAPIDADNPDNLAQVDLYNGYALNENSKLGGTYTYFASNNHWINDADAGDAFSTSQMKEFVKSGNVLWHDPEAEPAAADATTPTGPLSGLDVPNNPAKGDVLYQKYDGQPVDKITWTGSQWTMENGGYAGSNDLIKTLADQGIIFKSDPGASAATTDKTGSVSGADIEDPEDGDQVWLNAPGSGPTKYTWSSGAASWLPPEDSDANAHAKAWMQQRAEEGAVSWDEPAAAAAPSPVEVLFTTADLKKIFESKAESSDHIHVKVGDLDASYHWGWDTDFGVFRFINDDPNLSSKSGLWMQDQVDQGVATWNPAPKKFSLSEVVNGKKYGTQVSVLNEDGTTSKYEMVSNGVGSYNWKNLDDNDQHGKSKMGMALSASAGKVTLIKEGDGTSSASETAPADKPATKDFNAGDLVTGDDLGYLKAGDGVKAFDDSTVVLHKQNNGVFVNAETGTVYAPPFVSDMLGDHGKFVGHDDSKIFDQPYTGPEYLHSPKSHTSGVTTEADAKAYTGDNAIAADPGTVLIDADGGFWVKTNDGASWYKFKDGVNVGVASNTPGGGFYNKVDQHQIAPYALAGPKTSKYGLTPGKYSNSGAAAYMVVQSDGSGVYVNSKGAAKKLTVEAAKKNFDAGMQNYGGVPAEMPQVTEPVKKAPVKSVADVPDGTYYDGHPDGEKTSIYTIAGDTVTITKPMPGKIANAEVGGSANSNWAEAAGPGAVVKSDFAGGTKYTYVGYGKGDGGGGYKTVPFDKDTYTITKQADGTWKDGTGKTTTWADFLALPYNDAYYTTVVSHGVNAPVVLEKKKANTLFAQGKLLDEFGNSVNADDYDGTITVFGWQSPVAGLLQAKKIIDATPAGEKPKIKTTTGVNFDANLAKKYWSTAGIPDDTTEQWKALSNLIGLMTAKVVAPATVDTDAKKLFHWDAQGKPQFPAALVGKNPYPDSVSEINAYIKAASASVGDGNIIGQNMEKADKYTKQQWMQAFAAGNFGAMYNLELKAGGDQKKSHPSGFKHPGSAENPETQQITWGPAVDGEKPASETIPGNWTTGYSLKPSKEEVANYLIAAQMQNPTYLTLDERRLWVKAHQSHQQSTVDQLSVTAQNRKASGLPEQSGALAWTWDLKPAKSYDSMFEGADKNPTEGWGTDAAGDYYDDNVSKQPGLQAAYDNLDPNQYYYEGDKKFAAVIAYFQGIKDAAAAEALIPVYKKDPVQKVKGSTHPIYDYHDQFGTHYFFKPSPGGDQYRTEAEHLGNEFGKVFGFSTTDSKVLTLDGSYGNLQKDVGGVSDLLNVDYGTLTSQQIADIGMEHLLDHFEDNDDTKGDNAKVLENGHIVGIDKGRAFKHYGAWKSLSADDQMNSNADTIYARLYNAIRAGKFKKEDLDKAYLQVHKRAVKMQRVSDERVKAMLAEGMAKRQVWDVKYKVDGKPVPGNLAGLTAAVLDRKSHLVDDFDTMWAKVYTDAGLGALPEPPKITLAEDKPSGLEDPMLHEAVFKVDSHGKSTSLGSGDFKDGAAVLWADFDDNNTASVNGETTLMPGVQSKVQSWLEAHATTGSASKSDPSGLSVHDIFGDNIVAAAKTINYHVGKGDEPDASKIQTYKQSMDQLEADRKAWDPNLVGNSENGASYLFPSGQKVAMKQVDQYKLMLDYYHDASSKVETGLANKAKVEKIPAYEPVALGNPPAVFINGNKKLTKLSDGSFIYNDGSTLSMVPAGLTAGDPVNVDASNAIANAKAGTDGWTALSDKPTAQAAEVKVTMRKTHDRVGEFKNGKLHYTDEHLQRGNTGSEYEVELPTGEKIWFRSMKTGAAYSQDGRLSFKLPKVKTEDDSQASMARVMTQLQAMGIDPEPADNETAERTYWRSMYQLLAKRKHDSGSGYAKAWKDVKAKQAELGFGSEYDGKFLEALSKSYSVTDENNYWRSLWAKYFGQDKVDALVQSEGYLPHYEHMDWTNPDIGVGKPKFKRFEADEDKLMKSGNWLGSTNTTDSSALVKSVKSGGMLSTEERLRYYGQAIGGMSSFSGEGTNDQDHGSAGGIYTRIASESGVASGYDYIYSPKSMLWTSTYSLTGDKYGAVDKQANSSPSGIESALAYGEQGNETMLPDTAALGGDLEIIVYDSTNQRQEAIDFLKKRGIDKINGLAVEDRLVMRKDVKAALKKVRESWTTAA